MGKDIFEWSDDRKAITEIFHNIGVVPVKKTAHQIFVGTVATVLGTILALLIWWIIESHLPDREPMAPEVASTKQ